MHAALRFYVVHTFGGVLFDRFAPDLDDLDQLLVDEVSLFDSGTAIGSRHLSTLPGNRHGGLGAEENHGPRAFLPIQIGIQVSSTQA